VLDLGTLPALPQGGGPESPAEAVSSSRDVLQQVGERVSAGVKPISGSARHAFSFLLGPPPEPAPTPRDTQGSL
jgi:hypothetical protein